MPVYRIHTDLGIESGGYYRRGEVSELKEVSKNGIEALLGKGVITLAKTPPLSILPKWKEISEVLVEYDIITVEDFLSEDVSSLANMLAVEEETVVKLKVNAKKYIYAKEV